MRHIYLIAVVLIFQLSFSTAGAQTVKIYSKAGLLKSTHSTIASAFSVCVNGDSLLLSPHTFDEHDLYSMIFITDFNSRCVLQGTILGTDTSTIDAKGLGSVLSFNGTIRDVVLTGGTAGLGSYRGMFAGHTTVRNNTIKNSALMVATDFTICDNVRIINNTVTYDVGSSIPALIILGLRGNGLTIKDNVVIAGNKAGLAPIAALGQVDRGDTSVVKRTNSLRIEGDVRIEHNEGVRSGVIYVYGSAMYVSIEGGSIAYNTFTGAPDSSAAVIMVDTGSNGGGAMPYDSIAVTQVRLSHVRLYNPTADGSRQTEVLIRSRRTSTIPKPYIFSSDACWWGENDTTGLIKKDPGTVFTMPNRAVTNWYCNPIGTAGSRVSATMKLNTGGALPSSSLKSIQGKFFASAGTFSAATAAINSGNVVSSDFTYPSSGTYAVTAVIDADTFRPTPKMLGIKELGFEQVKIYPNPAIDFINIDGSAIGSNIALYDLLGHLIKNEKATINNAVLDVKGLPAGTYILKITTEEGREGSASIILNAE